MELRNLQAHFRVRQQSESTELCQIRHFIRRSNDGARTNLVTEDEQRQALGSGWLPCGNSGGGHCFGRCGASGRGSRLLPGTGTVWKMLWKTGPPQAARLAQQSGCLSFSDSEVVCFQSSQNKRFIFCLALEKGFLRVPILMVLGQQPPERIFAQLCSRNINERPSFRAFRWP
jgi:hypothetical protein